MNYFAYSYDIITNRTSDSCSYKFGDACSAFQKPNTRAEWCFYYPKRGSKFPICENCKKRF